MYITEFQINWFARTYTRRERKVSEFGNRWQNMEVGCEWQKKIATVLVGGRSKIYNILQDFKKLFY